MESRKVAAIIASEELADKLLNENLEIADDYRSGMSHKEIAVRYHLMEMGYSLGVCRSAIYLALKTLIPDEDERRQLARRIRSRCSRNRPPQFFQKLGHKTHVDKKGIFGLSPERKREMVTWNIISKGLVPWEGNAVEIETGKDELAYLAMLLENPRYKYPGKHCRYATNWQAIVNKLNDIFHGGKPVRTTKTAQAAKAKHKLKTH